MMHQFITMLRVILGEFKNRSSVLLSDVHWTPQILCSFSRGGVCVNGSGFLRTFYSEFRLMKSVEIQEQAMCEHFPRGIQQERVGVSMMLPTRNRRKKTLISPGEEGCVMHVEDTDQDVKRVCGDKRCQQCLVLQKQNHEIYAAEVQR